MNNPLRMEDWRQMLLGVLMPPMLLLMLLGNTTTWLCIQLSREARRGLKLGRDHVADGEAIRVTHFPEALLSAIEKIGGRGAFVGSHRVDGMLFDGKADHEGGSHPAIADRLDAIRRLGEGLLNPARQRLDTRGPAQAKFGRRPHGAIPSAVYPLDAFGVPLERPRPPSRQPLLTLLTDRPLYMEWHNATVAWAEAQFSQRNAFGLAPKLLLPLVAAFAALGFLYWPKDGDLSKLAKLMNPAGMVDFARQTSGTFCTGPSYPDGKCTTNGAPAAKPSSPFVQIGPAGGTAASNRSADHWQDGTSGTTASKVMPLLFLSLVGLALFRPKLLRRLFGQIEPLAIVRSKPVELDYGKPVEAAYVKPPEVEPARPRWADISGEEMVARSQQLAKAEQSARSEQVKWRAQPMSNSPQSAPVFGRRRG